MYLRIFFVLLLAGQGYAQEVVIKDTISDTSHILGEPINVFVLNSGGKGSNGSSRSYIQIQPSTCGILKEITIAVSFENSNSGPNNTPSKDPFDIGISLFRAPPGDTEDAEKIDFIYEIVQFDNTNQIGTKNGFAMFPVTIDVSSQGWSISKNEVAFISIFATNALTDEVAIVHLTDGLGSVQGSASDSFFLGFLGGPFPVFDFFAPGEMFVCQVVVSNSVLLGDVNLDNSVDLLDVAPFVELLTKGSFQAEADINQDGDVDLLDVAPFVDLLTGQ